MIDRKQVEAWIAANELEYRSTTWMTSAGVGIDAQGVCRALLAAWDVIDRLEKRMVDELDYCLECDGHSHEQNCALAAVLAQARGTTIDIPQTSEET